MFPLSHPVLADSFSWNLTLYGSFSLQGLAETFHFAPLRLYWTGHAGQTQLFWAALSAAIAQHPSP